MRFIKGLLSGVCILCFVSLPPAFGESVNVKEHVIYDACSSSAESMTYVIFLGDYELTREKYEAMDETSKAHLSAFLKYVTNRGLTIVNFEMLLPRSDLFAIEFLSRGGVDAAIVANNHSCDHGEKNIIETEKRLLDWNIQPIGSKTNPFLKLVKKGMHCNVFAIANKMDVECDGVIRLQDGDFIEQTIEYLTSEDTPLIVVLDDGGPSQFITDYEESKLKPFLDDGADLALMLGGHFMKGYRFYNDNSKLAIFSVGNFMLHWRGKEEYISIAPVIGFENGKITYFAIIPFYEELGQIFRILQNDDYRAAIDLYLKRTNTPSAEAYTQNDTKKLVGQSLVDLLKGERWNKVKPRHAIFFLKFLLYNYYLPVGIGIFLVIFSLVFRVYLKKQKRR